MAKVFVFTAAYNAEKTIERTIESIVKQTFSDWVYHIVDNGSTDKTLDIINSYTGDSRITVHHREQNNSLFWLEFLSPVVKKSGVEWFCHIDADDEYAFEFIDKMYNFVTINSLDLAACGYSKVDGITNDVLSTRVLNKNLILQGDDFVDKFIEYRGFTIYWWAKMMSIPIFLNVLDSFVNPSLTCNDSVFMLDMYYESNRVGILSEALIKYYQYPDSFLRRTFSEEFEKGQMELWKATKKYLLRYGKINKLNEDFLYAIYFSQLEEMLERIEKTNLSFNVKSEILLRIYNCETTVEMFKRDADPQFKNLLRCGDMLARFNNMLNEVYYNDR